MDKFLAAKRPGEVDIEEVQDIKRMIRESEAVAGSGPWVSTRARPASSTCRSTRRARCARIRSARRTSRSSATLLEEVEPDQVFVAGDLSDPHGTHRMCKEAIDRALEEYDAAGGSRPEVWLYRGAWQEWPVTEATWLVPLSQEELRLKIQAIFKHQSQKDTAPFPGPRRAGVLAAGGGAEQGDGGGARSAGAGGVLRDGGVCSGGARR